MTDNMEQNDMNPNQLSMTGEGFENGLNGELAESADEAFWEPTDRELYLSKLPIADKHLPPVMRENVLCAPANRKIPVFLTCAVCLAALATRLRFRYPFEKRLHMPLLYLIIEGEPSSGKGFANEIVTQIMGPTLTEHDNAQRRLEQEYREKKQSRKANEKIGPAPKTIIREIPANVSKTVLVKRADMCERILGDTLTFFMYAEELAQLTDAGSQSYSQLRTLTRVAWDLGSKFGLDFASDNSYSAIVDINMCYLFLATPNDVDDYMIKKSIMGGNVTRNIIYTIEDDLGSSAAEFKSVTAGQQAVIDKTLRRIMDDTYLEDNVLAPVIMMDMSWLEKDVRRWCEEKRLRGLAGSSDSYRVFYKRSSLSAYRIAAVCKYLYDIEGVDEMTAQRRCKRLYRWLAELIHTNLLNRWGERYDTYEREKKKGEPVGGRIPLFDQLSETFTRDQLQQLIVKNEFGTPLRVVLSKWRTQGWIRQVQKNVFEKSNQP